ncbi:cryptochrome/photolyase family protein [Paraferrimonas sp. SM1919]|uniref:cryptochrome/photolyase family protein n=1 Tax=Paraferrimonas sp. SM1919 TaxID=2662263 RepID=UPI0013D0D264|nr:cryptochrome/photolyase family protein [Paraferrimonas sp. SM1919]
MKHYKTLRLILGDQLNHQHSWYSQIEPSCLYVIAELNQEANYVHHHIQKISGFFMAMAAFAEHLSNQGHQVLHLTLDDTAVHPNLTGLITSLAEQYQVQTFEYQRPDEYRLQQQLEALVLPPAIAINRYESEHFLFDFKDIEQHFVRGKHKLMGHFYQYMRKTFGVLMLDEQKPLGGKWSFDTDNRQKLKATDLAALPQPLLFANDVSQVIDRINRHQVQTLGHIGNQLIWPINREQSLQVLQHFCKHCLPHFGQFQDAMTAKHPSMWSLYHSRLSFSLNTKMLSPLEVLHAAVDAYANSEGKISLAQIEGFVRQILGWREYIRGIYWANMPEYSNLNALNANNNLPDYFWTGETKMSCMQHATGQSLDYAYAHHIQRLMVTGNFALLTAIDPQQVEQWYLGIYIDAIEWVEMPNTRGMALFADNGIIATKPYAASGNYINKMSDYCKDCHYNISDKSGETACPFNGFYWHFMNKHRDKFANNPRTAMIYRTWDKMDESVRQGHLQTAEMNLARLNQL